MAKHGKLKSLRSLLPPGKRHINASDERIARRKIAKENVTPGLEGKITMKRPELFLFSNDILKFSKTDEKEINATYSNMEEIGIANMPYSMVDIGMVGFLHEDANGFHLNDSEHSHQSKLKCDVVFRYIKNDDGYKCDIMFKIKTWHEVHAGMTKEDHLNGSCAKYHEQAERFRKTLIVLLATKGVIKTRTKDKLLAMRIGKRRLADNMRPIYTTTLSLPLPVAPQENPATHHHLPGIPKRPHLRRGHVRQQRHGPKYEFVKQIWVEPCFINADENFVSSRFSYNTSMKAPYADSPSRPL